MATCTCDCCNPDTPTTLNYKATDSLGQEHTYVNSGTWGPPEGFNIPAEYQAITGTINGRISVNTTGTSN